MLSPLSPWLAITFSVYLTLIPLSIFFWLLFIGIKVDNLRMYKRLSRSYGEKKIKEQKLNIRTHIRCFWLYLAWPLLPWLAYSAVMKEIEDDD